MSLLGLSPSAIATPAMRAIFDDAAVVQAMLAFEVALARAEERCGVIPRGAAAAIAAAAQGAAFDLEALESGQLRGGTPAIAVVAALVAEVARHDAAAAGWVHFGATSQDVVDTALVLQLRRALAELDGLADALLAALRTLVAAHAGTPMLGRTLLQPGPPITFGLKAAGWLAAVARSAARLRAAGQAALVLQFGGAVGTLASLGDAGPGVAAVLADELGLRLPPAPWHTQRDALVAFGTAASLLGGVAGKMALDIVLLSQAELGEVAEASGGGRGGSSTMPHKRNPVGCVIARAAAQRLPGLVAGLLAGMAQEHERAAGAWQAEASAISEIVLAVSGALTAMAEVATGLRVDAARMRRNIDDLRGVVLAERLMLTLAPRLGRREAHALVEALVGEAVARGAALHDVAAGHPRVTEVLAPQALRDLFDPAGYLGSSALFIDRMLAAASADQEP